MTPQAWWIKAAVSLLLGIGSGIVLHFTLYRIGLPLYPFVYQAF